MKILADENIPHVKELFSGFGEIITCDGRKISPDKLLDVDVLLVRSVTKVNKTLLEHSAVRFVGTTTIGLDHLDTDWLKQQGIAYKNAPGCNSIAVAEYILSGLLALADEFKIDLRNTKVAIIGAGNVGTAVAKRLDILSIPFGLFDPPLAQQGDKRKMLSEKELLKCEIVSLHVPLTNSDESQWPTEGMVDKQFFNKMKHMKYLINSSRGHVIDGPSLKNWLHANNQNQAIIDVWENEPYIDRELVEKCFLSTPHIAGHTSEGKTRGTLTIFHAFCKHFGYEDSINDDTYLRVKLPKDIIHLQRNQNFMQALSSAIWSVYNIRHDDKALRGGLTKDITKHFDRLRKGYKERREFSTHRLDAKSLPDGSRRTLTKLGFRTSDS